MKKLTFLLWISFCAFLLLPVNSVMGQGSTNQQAYAVHEDVVLPSMVGEYEKISKEFMDVVNKYNIQGMGWIASQTNDYRYLFIRPIANMGDLDNNAFWTNMREKMGAEKFSDMFNRMNKCYDLHCDYVLNLDKDLSYMPGGITQTPAGKDYRRFYYLHTTPQLAGKLAESIKAVKDMFVKKGSKMDYRIYRSGFGTRGQFFMVAIAAKDGADYEAMDAANNALLGPEAEKTFGEMMKYITKFEEVTGRMRPDLAYSPK